MHMPPPVHGAAMMGKYIQESETINSSFNCRFVNLSTGAMGDTGNVSWQKMKKVLSIYYHSLKYAIFFKPDLVYFTPCANGPSFRKKEYPLAQILKKFGYKIIVHLHNKGVSEVQDDKKYDKIFRKFYKGIKVILLSERLYDDVKKYVKHEDVYICPNGIPDIDYVYKPRHNEVPHILFLSNLLVGKGVLVLLDALKILKDKGYSFICEFVGSETHEIDANRFAEEVNKRQLNQFAIYHGKKYGDEKNEFFEKTDIFAFPTFYANETFGLVNLEAMQYHLPVISTDEGGIPDIIEDGGTGFICEKKDSEALADRISQLLEDKELRERMGNNGYQRQKLYFTIKQFEMRMTEILSTALTSYESPVNINSNS